MVYKTLNNGHARRVIRHALEYDYRSCAYALYNLHCSFAPEPYKRLFYVVVDLLGSFYDDIFVDTSIGFEVKYFIRSYFININLPYEKI